MDSRGSRSKSTTDRYAGGDHHSSGEFHTRLRIQFQIILSGAIDSEEKFRLVHAFPSKYSVCDNKWHRIDIIYEGELLIMRVDHSDVKHALRRRDSLTSTVTAQMYIGGLPGKSRAPHLTLPRHNRLPLLLERMENGKPALETRDNFKGCIRSFLIGEERKDFTEMDVRHNVLIGSCPILGHH